MAHLTNPPFITAIIPVYNGAAYLNQALTSMAGQTVPPQAIIAVDDGSTDATPEVIQTVAHQLAQQPTAPALHYHYQTNQGASAAINAGVHLALTEFPATEMLAFLDADDLWTETKLALQLDLFAQDPALEAAFGQTRQFFSDELPDAARLGRVNSELVAARHSGAMLIRRAAWQRIGPMNTGLKAGFLEWLTRADRAGLRSAFVDSVVVLRRIHDSNISQRERSAIQSDYFQILKAHLDRRRTDTQ